MRIRLIRNATLWIEYAGIHFLVDPMLGPKGSQKPFPNSPRQDLRNPLADLPVPAEDLLDPDVIVVTHLHRDHFDRAAAQMLPKNKPVLVQNEEDAEKIQSYGFLNVQIAGSLLAEIPNGIGLVTVPARHSFGTMARLSGPACGLVFFHAGEKTLYVTGDTVWYPEVEKALKVWKPDVVVANCGENTVNGFPPLIMGKEGVKQIHDLVPEAMLVACHMESLNHWGLSRKELGDYALQEGFSSSLIIPEDGQLMEF